ncbi:unnamed protein product [Brugia pahangi]|uniref:Uncharacterized protein n=1 Tax=Brugia pahangi TaxID=6280 RepID=A0A0N4TEH8_BRUPA|nr:unnamed protein product [Brugia pahangi]
MVKLWKKLALIMEHFRLNGQLRRNLSAISTDEILTIWSEILYENGRLHIVDYLASKLKTFRYPIDSTEN